MSHAVMFSYMLLVVVVCSFNHPSMFHPIYSGMETFSIGLPIIQKFVSLFTAIKYPYPSSMAKSYGLLGIYKSKFSMLVFHDNIMLHPSISLKSEEAL